MIIWSVRLCAREIVCPLLCLWVLQTRPALQEGSVGGPPHHFGCWPSGDEEASVFFFFFLPPGSLGDLHKTLNGLFFCGAEQYNRPYLQGFKRSSVKEFRDSLTDSSTFHALCFSLHPNTPTTVIYQHRVMLGHSLAFVKCTGTFEFQWRMGQRKGLCAPRHSKQQ